MLNVSPSIDPSSSVAFNPDLGPIDRSLAFWTTIKGDGTYRARLHEAADELLKILKREFPSQAPAIRKTPAQHVEILAVFLHSFAHVLSQPDKFEGVGIGLNQNQFRKGQIYHHLQPYSVFCRAFDMLAGRIEGDRPAEGPFCSIKPGYFDRTGGTENHTSRLFPLPRLKDFLVTRGLIWRGHPFQKIRSRETARMVAQNVSGDFLWVNKTAKANGTKKPDYWPIDRKPSELETVIPRLTETLSRAQIAIKWEHYGQYRECITEEKPRKKRKTALDEPPKPKHRCSVVPAPPLLFRSFSGQDGSGGRIYGHWVQNVPSRFRHLITFHGRPSTEYDYRAQHLSIAYSLCGAAPADPEKDLYAIDGFDLPDRLLDRWGYEITDPSRIRAIHREWFKDVATVSFGLPKEKRDKLASKVMGKDRENDRREAHIASKEDAQRLVDAFWAYHEPIAKWRCDSAWQRFQAEDSRISMEGSFAGGGGILR